MKFPNSKTKVELQDEQYKDIAKTKKDAALVDYCRRVIQRVDDILKKTYTADQSVVLMTQHRDWIAQQQQAAFDHGASSDQCADWIAKNLNDPRTRQ